MQENAMKKDKERDTRIPGLTLRNRQVKDEAMQEAINREQQKRSSHSIIRQKRYVKQRAQSKVV